MIGPIDHVGIAVRRLDEAIARYRALGLAPESIEELPSEAVRIAFLPAGRVDLELLEPLRPDGAVGRFLAKRGEGMHHLAFRVEDIAAAMDGLRDAGFDLVDREPRRGARGRLVAFIHPRSAHGVLLELVQSSSSRER